MARTGFAYANTTTGFEAEISMAIEKILVSVSTYGQYCWSPTAVDVGAPPSNFMDLGSVVEDSPSLTVRKEKFQMRTGLPRTLRYEAVVGVDAELSFQIYAKGNTVTAIAAGFKPTDLVSIAGIGMRLPFGRTTLRHIAVLGVCDFVDNSAQVLHWFPDCVAKPEFTETHRPDDVGKMPFAFDCYSYVSTIHGSEQILGERIAITTVLI